LIDSVEVDCSNLKLGDILKVADLDVAKNKNIEILTHMDVLVASVIASKNDVADADEAAEAEKEESKESK